MASSTISANMTSDTVETGLTPLTKEAVVEVIANMRLLGGAPASDKMKKAYVCRLGGLLKRNALQLLDQPEKFKEALDVEGRSATSSLGFVKSATQFINTLCQTGRWHEFYRGDLNSAAVAYRQLIRELGARDRIETAARKRANEDE